MPGPTNAATQDPATIDRLSAAFGRCYSTFEVDDDVFTDDVFFDLLPPLWRFQIIGQQPFLDQLRAVAEGEVEIEVLRTIPTATGFVTEHVETERASEVRTARRIHLCEVRGGRISAVTTYCNGPWDDELRERHAVEAPMLRR